MDLSGTRLAFCILALVAFNIPVFFAVWRLRTVNGLSDALREKAGPDDKARPISYSRVTGMIGATIVGSLFWIISNIAIVIAIENPKDLTILLSSVSRLFLVGAALFLPYAFNQLKSIIE